MAAVIIDTLVNGVDSDKALRLDELNEAAYDSIVTNVAKLLQTQDTVELLIEKDPQGHVYEQFVNKMTACYYNCKLIYTTDETDNSLLVLVKIKYTLGHKCDQCKKQLNYAAAKSSAVDAVHTCYECNTQYCRYCVNRFECQKDGETFMVCFCNGCFRYKQKIANVTSHPEEPSSSDSD